MNNQYPLQGIAQHLQAQGRAGDSVLVHMNPAEVQGLASLSPTGQLTINPQTGQPEAFLPALILPMLASWGGSAAAGAGLFGTAMSGTLGSAIAGGLASGVAQGALTGDWEKSLATGMIGAGLGAAAGGAAEAVKGAEVAADAGEALLSEGTQAAIDAAGELAPEAIAEQVAQEAASSAISPLTEEATTALAEEGIASLGQEAVQNEVPELLARGAETPPKFGWNPDALKDGGYMDALKRPFGEGGNLGGRLIESKNYLPMAYGMGSLAQQEADEAWQKQQAQLLGDWNQQRSDAYGRQQNAYRYAQNRGGYAAGGQIDGGGGGSFSPTTTSYINTTQTQGSPYSSSNYSTFYDRLSKKDKKKFDKWANQLGISIYDFERARGGGIDPIAVQGGLRGETSVDPRIANPNYRPGFDAEAMYFQDIRNEDGELDPSLITAPESTWNNPQYQAALYPELQRMERDPNAGSFLKSFAPEAQAEVEEIVKKEDSKAKKKKGGYAAGGDVALQTDFGPHNIPGGGISALPSQFVNPQEQTAPAPPPAQPQADNPSPMMAQPEAGGEPSEQDIQMLALAITGKIGDKADMVVERFIEEFGVETFREAREFILKFYGGENAQTEGMVQGQGGGMDDMVPGTIAGQEGVAVSPGEYIVPADVVSGLGDGSSDAGATELDAMSDRVRMARGGDVKQPPPFDATRVLPA